MGNFINNVTRHLFKFPIELHPICFLRKEEYNSTGQLISTEMFAQQDLEYKQLLQNFTENLKAKRKHGVLHDYEQMSILKSVSENFPGWDDLTVSVLHHLYLQFADPKNYMLSFYDFCAILEYLGDRSSEFYRGKKFDKADSDEDGFLAFSEFLSVLYNFNHPKKTGLQGLAMLCTKAADRSRTISSLTLGEQLDYGLF